MAFSNIFILQYVSWVVCESSLFTILSTPGWHYIYISLRIVFVCICIVPVGNSDHFARCYMTAWSNWLLKHQRHSIVYSWIELRPCVSRMTWFGLTPVFVGHIPRLADKTNCFSGDETHNSSQLCKYSRIFQVFGDNKPVLGDNCDNMCPSLEIL